MQPTSSSPSRAVAAISSTSYLRAALSIVLNTAEGAGRISPRDKASFYVRARGSTTESAAVIDVCLCLNLIDEAQARQPKDMLDRIAQMLTKLIKAHQT